MSQDSNRLNLRALLDVIFVFAVFLAGREVGRFYELTFAGSLGVFAAIFVIAMFYRPLGRFGIKQPGTPRRFAILCGYGILIAPLMIAIINILVVPIVTNIGLALPTGEYFNFIVGEPLIFIFYIVVVAWIAAGLGEELFIRGFMMTKLADTFGNGVFGWGLALVLQAVVFGLAHAYQGAGGMIITGSVGFFMGIFYLLGGRSLIPVVIAHALIDTISLTQIFLSGGSTGGNAATHILTGM